MTMPLIFAIPFILITGAVVLRGVGRADSRLARFLGLSVPLSAGAVLLLPYSAQAAGGAGDWWSPDGIFQAAAVAALLTALIAALMEGSPVLVSASLWSGGMLVLCSLSLHPILLWAAVQFSVVPLLFYDRDTAERSWQTVLRHPDLLGGSGLFGAGTLLVFTATSALRTIGIILLLGGLGGMLGWFPFPRVVSRSRSAAFPVMVLGSRFLPLLTAGVFLERLIELRPLTDSQIFLIVVVAMFSLLICSTRLHLETRLSRRLSLAALSTLCFLVVAVCLLNWERTHPARAWSASSNLPGGRSLFISILGCEAAGILALAAGYWVLLPQGEETDFVEPLAGSVWRRPWLSLPILTGALSLAGIPPFPGCWWRFSLLAALILPHRQSILTRLSERDYGFVLLALTVLLAWIINGLGHLRLIQQLVFEEPIRLRGGGLSPGRRIAAAAALIALLAVACMPLSLGMEEMSTMTQVPVPSE